MYALCPDCGWPLEKPSIISCDNAAHPQPSRSESIVIDIIEDLSDRRGLRQEFQGCDTEIQAEIFDAWRDIVASHLNDALE